MTFVKIKNVNIIKQPLTIDEFERLIIDQIIEEKKKYPRLEGLEKLMMNDGNSLKSLVEDSIVNERLNKPKEKQIIRRLGMTFEFPPMIPPMNGEVFCYKIINKNK